MLAGPEHDHSNRLKLEWLSGGRESIVGQVRGSGPGLEFETVQFSSASIRIEFSPPNGSIRSSAKGGISTDFRAKLQYCVD
jgi:hypothetical protein